MEWLETKTIFFLAMHRLEYKNKLVGSKLETALKGRCNEKSTSTGNRKNSE